MLINADLASGKEIFLWLPTGADYYNLSVIMILPLRANLRSMLDLKMAQGCRIRCYLV